MDGIGTNARFFYPAGVEIGVSGSATGGNIYIADVGNAIRAMSSTTFSVTTLAGQGPSLPGTDNGIGTNAKFAVLNFPIQSNG